jgi:deoxyribonuclease V
MCLADERWRPTQEQAISIQKWLKPLVEIRPLEGETRKIAGADVAYSRKGRDCFAAIVVLDGPVGKVIDQAVVRNPVPYPYVSGLLAFRELPPLVHAFSQLREVPDLLFVDGHGILHPRGVGLASHLGILLDIPTIGCAKGPPLQKPGPDVHPRGRRGSYNPLSLTGDRPAGAVLHTRDRHKPLYASPGHRITLQESIQWVLEATGRYRVPEPLRQAHQLAGRARHEAGSAVKGERP